MTWAVVETGTYQHIFKRLDKPYKMMGKLVQWASICGRSYTTKEPQPNPKKLKCKFCVEKENEQHGNNL